MAKGMSKKIFIVIGVIIVGIIAALSFNTSSDAPQESGDPRIVSWRHVHGLGVSASEPNLLYIATHGDFYHSRNGGSPVKVDKVRADYMAFNAPYQKDVPLYASGHPATGGNTGLIKSTDGGVTWQKVSDVLNPPVDFHAMALSKSDPNTIIGFDSGGRGLFKTSDAGNTWDTLPFPEYISSIVILPDDSNKVFIGTGKGIYQSNDGGVSWAKISQYDGITILALGIDEKGVLYASTSEFGLSRSEDLGKTWQQIKKPNLTILTITPDSMNNLVYVAGYSPEGFQEVYKISSENIEMIGTNKGLK
jgi:photosystem II stability/assembly factor-like uncharacterized protein